ncbi:TRAP transporter small permease subunit [Pararhodobacter zhoushanensis]|uniref:TRAP transporter small permease subunit n=1 Tax=Pararhodobacter zhoushanensis TaxID=2479545 RepID=UPI001C709638|nr:TRAP transporter small permease subunit [Pararhodobacter zhoushanensis]
MGTLLSIITLMASAVIVVLDPTSMLVFYALGVIIVSHIGAWLLKSTPGWFMAASLLGWSSIMISTPLALTTTQLNQLARLVRRQRDGWEEAQVTLDFFEPLVPYATPLLIAATIFFLVLAVLALRGAAQGTFRYMMDASRGLAKACTTVGKAAAFLFLPMMLIILYDVIQRKYLGWSPDFTSTDWYKTFTSTRLQEMEWHLHATLFLLALGYGYVHDAHVRIELVRDVLRPRTRAWIELFGALLFMVPYCYVVIEYGSENALRAYNIGEGSDALTGLPYRFIIKGMLPLGFVFVALAGLSAALKCVVYLFGPASMRAESGQYAGDTQHGQAAEA